MKMEFKNPFKISFGGGRKDKDKEKNKSTNKDVTQETKAIKADDSIVMKKYHTEDYIFKFTAHGPGVRGWLGDCSGLEIEAEGGIEHYIRTQGWGGGNYTVCISNQENPDEKQITKRLFIARLPNEESLKDIGTLAAVGPNTEGAFIKAMREMQEAQEKLAKRVEEIASEKKGKEQSEVVVMFQPFIEAIAKKALADEAPMPDPTESFTANLSALLEVQQQMQRLSAPSLPPEFYAQQAQLQAQQAPQQEDNNFWKELITTVVPAISAQFMGGGTGNIANIVEALQQNAGGVQAQTPPAQTVDMATGQQVTGLIQTEMRPPEAPPVVESPPPVNVPSSAPAETRDDILKKAVWEKIFGGAARALVDQESPETVADLIIDGMVVARALNLEGIPEFNLLITDPASAFLNLANQMHNLDSNYSLSVAQAINEGLEDEEEASEPYIAPEEEESFQTIEAPSEPLDADAESEPPSDAPEEEKTVEPAVPPEDVAPTATNEVEQTE